MNLVLRMMHEGTSCRLMLIHVDFVSDNEINRFIDARKTNEMFTNPGGVSERVLSQPCVTRILH